MEAIVFYAPGQDSFPVTLKRVKDIAKVDPDIVKEALGKTFSLSRWDETESGQFTAELACAGGTLFDMYGVSKALKEILTRIIFKGENLVREENASLKQACMMALLNVEHLCLYKKMGNPDKEKSDIFYAGCSFGEFWALTHTISIGLPMAVSVYLAYLRGKAMMNAVKSEGKKYYAICIPNILLKDGKLELCHNSKLGKLVKSDETTVLYGTREELEPFEKQYEVKMISCAIPYHSIRLYSAGVSFGRTVCEEIIGKDNLTDKFITDKKTFCTKEIMAQQFFLALDERNLRKVIVDTLKLRGYDEVAFINL